MNSGRWFLVVALAGAALVGWVVGSCAIDDDVTWVDGARCTGTCAAPPAGSYECDIDSACTPSTGCEDWDCSEEPPPDWVDPDSGPFLDAGDDDDATSGGDAGGDVAEDVPGCVPSGVGHDRATAEPVTLEVAEPGLTACLAVSGWLRFDLVAGTRFEVELSAADGAALAFQVYAGADPAVLAAATISGTGTFGLEVAASATFYVRVRAVTSEPTEYTAIVRAL